jgi:hypothetical protein
MVVPKKAYRAAASAVSKQIRWILNRPAQGGIDTVNFSRSEYFDYGRYRDARVDVENKVGHNLRR